MIKKKNKDHSPDNMYSSVKFDEKDSLTDIRVEIPVPSLQSPLKNSAYRKRSKSRFTDADDLN